MELPVGFVYAAIRIDGPSPADPAVVTFGCSDDGTSAPDNLAEAIFHQFADNFDDEVCEDYAFLDCAIKLNRSGPIRDGYFADSQAGLETTNPVAPQVCVLIKKTTGFAGRAYRGRMYLPGAPVSDFDFSGTLIGASQSAWQSSADDFFNGMAGLGLDLHLLHNSPLIDPTPITNLVVDGRMATQRRRVR